MKRKKSKLVYYPVKSLLTTQDILSFLTFIYIYLIYQNEFLHTKFQVGFT